MKKLILMIIITIGFFNSQTMNITSQNMEYSKLNTNKNQLIQLELNKLPNDLIKTLNDMNVKIKVNNDFLENSDFKYDGQYHWFTKEITLDDAQSSISHALYHEIGHALDDLFVIRENDNIIKSFNECEFYFGGNNYYNNDIKEYVAQGIYHYYKEDLDKDSILYTELNSILSDFENNQ